MKFVGATLALAATDLGRFLGCRHRTGLELAVARGQRVPPEWVDPLVQVLRERGLEHERSYIEQLRSEGLKILDLSGYDGSAAEERTIQAMREGVAVIVQGALRKAHWVGRPDVLRRLEVPSAFGPWSYQVVDTKLALQTRGGTILQLVLYCELLQEVQRAVPEQFHVVTPDPKTPVQSFRLSDFAAYFRLVRGQLVRTTANTPESITAANYPEPVEHCQVCAWWKECDRRRRSDDHLSLVAGVSRLQRRELAVAGVETLAQLATMPLPPPAWRHQEGALGAIWRPVRGRV